MMNLFASLGLITALFGLGAGVQKETVEENIIKVVDVSSSMTMVEKRVRQASVRVLSGNGHG